MEVKKVVKLPKLLPFQKEIITLLDREDVKYVSLLKSRQVGGSFLNKILVSKWALENNNAKILFITPTLKLGKLFYKELSESLKQFIKNANGTELKLEFQTGSYCQFLSAESGNALRGFQCDFLLLDEAAYISDDVWNLILRPMTLIRGKKIIMCSTPCSTDNFFYNHVQYGFEHRPGYESIKVTIYDNPFITPKDIEEIKSQVPNRVWLQEYEAEFLSGSGSVFTKFNECILKNNPTLDGKYYAAIDLAKQNDFTVLTIMNSKKEVVFRYRINNLEYVDQVKKLADILNKWKPVVTILETNNIGEVVAELLRKEYKGKMKYINLDNSFKREIIENLVVAFENGLIGIDNDPVLLRELAGFTVTYNPQTKSVKYAAKSSLHDDCVISLSYCYYAATKLSNSNYSISFI